MKKIISALLSIVMAVSIITLPAYAKVGDVIGTALHTDIVAYVNHYAIPSYAVNGTSVIVAEDLRNFGFDVAWNGDNRTLSVARNSNTYVNQMNFTKVGKTGEKFTNILETDIRVYVEGTLVTSYAMNGYTMIPVEELTMLGNVNWVAGERALKMWVDGLNIRSEKQPISISSSDTSLSISNARPSTVEEKIEFVKYINLALQSQTNATKNCTSYIKSNFNPSYQSLFFVNIDVAKKATKSAYDMSLKYSDMSVLSAPLKKILDTYEDISNGKYSMLSMTTPLGTILSQHKIILKVTESWV